MENTSSDFANEIKESLMKSLPDAPTIIKFIEPFLIPVQGDYERFLKIIEKLGIKNGIIGFVNILFEIRNSYFNNIDYLINGFMTEIGKRLYDKTAPPTEKKYHKILDDLQSFESLMIYGKDFYVSGHADIPKQYGELEKMALKLSDGERAIFDAFYLLLYKLFALQLITYTPITNMPVKEILLKYYKGINSLYDKEKIPYKLIAYIESVKLPNEEKFENSIHNEKEKHIPLIIIPVFQQVEDIYNVLQKYFDTKQHESLKKALHTGISKEKLVFKGAAKELADAFKKLFEARLIMDCNTKEELIEWIRTIFQYKSRSGVGIDMTQKYLNDIISTEQKPCQSPIIEIKRDEKGNCIIFSPDRRSKSILK